MPILIEQKARILGNTQGYGITPAKRGGAVQGIGGVGTYDAEMLGAAHAQNRRGALPATWHRHGPRARQPQQQRIPLARNLADAEKIHLR